MPHFLKLISTLKGFLNFLVCPTYSSAVFFLFIIIWQGQETLSIFSTLQYVLQTKELEIKGGFFKEKSTENHIRESPLDLHSSIVSGFETQQDGSQFFFKCKFEQHYTSCHHIIYVG